VVAFFEANIFVLCEASKLKEPKQVTSSDGTYKIHKAKREGI
jgi:hypothetical protein